MDIKIKHFLYCDELISQKDIQGDLGDMQDLQMDTETLASKSKEMEDKLQELRANMSKEKEQRGLSRGFGWMSEHCTTLNNNSFPKSYKKKEGNTIQKLSAGKLKIRVLKEESPTARPKPPHPVSPIGDRGTRNKLKGTICGQSKVKNPGSTDLQTPKSNIENVNRFHRQVLVANHGEEKNVGVTADVEKGLATLLKGEYNEEESARYFQEAVREWRGEKRGEGGQSIPMVDLWTSDKSVLVSSVETQADLPPDREAEGRSRGQGEERTTVKVEFTDNSLTYMERLLLKKYRRSPTEFQNPSLSCGTDLRSRPATDTEDESGSNLTAEEEDFRHYCASLFAVSSSRTESQITTPESCLVIEVFDETSSNILRVCADEKTTDNNNEAPSDQQISCCEITLASQTALSGYVSSRAGQSSASSAQLSRQSSFQVQPKTAKKLSSSKCQTTKQEHAAKESACLPAETPGTLKISVRTETLQPSKPIISPTIPKSKANCGSPKSSHSAFLFSADMSALEANRSAIPEEHCPPSPSASFPLRSTFTVSPSSSSESTLLPKVYHSAPLQRGSDSSLLSEQPQSSQLFAEPIPSPKLCEAPRGNLMSPQQSQRFICDPECLLLESPLTHSLSHVSARSYPSRPSLEPVLSRISSVPCSVSSYPCYRSSLKSRDEVLLTSTPTPGDHKISLSHWDAYCTASCTLLNVTQNPVKTVEDEELSTDSGDEMSSDSLGLVHEEYSSGEEAQMQGLLMRENFTETEVIQDQSAGTGSELFCDLDWVLPLGLDTDTGLDVSPERTYCDQLKTCQSTVHDLEPTVSESCGPTSSLRSCTEEHPVFRVMDNPPEPMEIQINSTRQGKSPKDPQTSGSILSDKSTSVISNSPKINPRPLSAPTSQVTQEIMEICNVDQTGCEDPDVDTDTAAYILHNMEQELRVLAKGTATITPCMHSNSGGKSNSKH